MASNTELVGVPATFNTGKAAHGRCAHDVQLLIWEHHPTLLWKDEVLPVVAPRGALLLARREGSVPDPLVVYCCRATVENLHCTVRSVWRPHITT